MFFTRISEKGWDILNDVNWDPIVKSEDVKVSKRVQITDFFLGGSDTRNIGKFFLPVQVFFDRSFLETPSQLSL